MIVPFSDTTQAQAPTSAPTPAPPTNFTLMAAAVMHGQGRLVKVADDGSPSYDDMMSKFNNDRSGAREKEHDTRVLTEREYNGAWGEFLDEDRNGVTLPKASEWSADDLTRQFGFGKPNSGTKLFTNKDGSVTIKKIPKLSDLTS